MTAAGYPGEAERFEKRLSGLLEAFRVLKIPPEVTNRSDPSVTTSSLLTCLRWMFSLCPHFFPHQVSYHGRGVQLSSEGDSR